MNKELAVFARQQIKDGLRLLGEGQVMLFKRMYSHTNLEATIDEAVDRMDETKLDWALTQVTRSVAKLQKQA